MKFLATFLVLVVILEHFFIMILEMFMIPSRLAKKSFGLSDDFMAQKQVQTLFSNQGLYNGFLATGLLWAYFIAPQIVQFQASILFLSFVLIAGLWGAYTSNKAILIKQGLPALLAILILCLSQ
ncbi:possible membrane protein [Mannheimia haemolytica PHL213]|uniref:DUF1304 domain-containing protein n=6 Tax=Pasteurellaceae TaxID=712 RepID=A0A2K9VRN3_HISSO|nr:MULTISPECIES: DUF1304 domain-containing protein [Pasteurellaceae]MCT8722012.1 DUF1304 domain-containing protein [Glaesserella parasuis]AGH37405.1 Membrane protein [Bibersteinia trehalosi USDA-ARS-USMARC-192]AHG85122.1 Membrane protein [Bibersteinia trehalosi USDA-ARS-USMARC-189]AKA11661.1 membrane protein [Mannheimia haemolytica]AKA14261.1 membrane protein [Mannheimia haemolytica]